MAENNQRSYRDRPRLRDAEEQPPSQADDPLAELARLIGQSVPMKTDRRAVAQEPASPRHDEFDHTHYAVSHEVLHETGDERGPAAVEYGQHEQDLDSDFRISDGHEAERYEASARATALPPLRSSRFRQDPDLAIAREHNADDQAHDSAYQEEADWGDRSADLREDRYTDEYGDEYENEPHDDQDAGYDDEHAEALHTGRRGGFVFVTAVFALAVLGTAGAFGYRAMFGSPAIPALPPIIKAEGGPTKIIPSDAKSQDSAPRQADAANARSGERLVSREERPVDIPPPVTSTVPRPVSTVPVFPDPPAMGGPGAIVGYSAGSSSGSPTISSEPPAPTTPPAPTPPAMTTGTAASTAGQAFPSPSAPPAAAATSPAAGPKKIRTVTIHTDPSGAPDPAAASSPSARQGSQPAQASNQGSNAPLSLVPAATEAPAVPARPRPASAAQPVPLNKPPANETASAVPVAPAATGGGYAVQVSSQHSEAEAQSSFRDLQVKYPDVLGGRTPIIRRADLGAKGIYFRAMVGPFTSAEQAAELCTSLKAAGGSCLVQKN